MAVPDPSTTEWVPIWSPSSQGTVGPQGPTGPQGPQGPVGPQGPGTLVQDEGGAAFPQRAAINFIGPAVAAADDSANNRVNVTVTIPAKVFQVGRTWGLLGDATGVSSLPSIFIPVKTGLQTVTLVGVRAKIGSGTSVGVQLTRNGSNLGSLITVTTTAATTVFSTVLADGDELGVTLSAQTGTPTNLSVTLTLEHSA